MNDLTFTLYHLPADPDAIRSLIEKLRLKALALGFQVGDLVVSVAPPACSFVASLADSDPLEVGLTYFACQVEIDGHTVPIGCPYWMWTASTTTPSVEPFSLLMQFAAGIGIEGFVSVGNRTRVYTRDDDGVVKVEEETDDL